MWPTDQEEWKAPIREVFNRSGLLPSCCIYNIYNKVVVYS